MYRVDNYIFRKPEQSDLLAIYDMKNDQSVRASLGGFTLGYSQDDIKRWVTFHQDCKSEAFFIIEEVNSKSIVGHIALYNIDQRVGKAEYGILISKDFQGKGVGKVASKFIIEIAFNELNLRRITLSVLSNNSRAISLYEKMGFKEEGLLKGDQFCDGKYVNVVLMALMKE